MDRRSVCGFIFLQRNLKERNLDKGLSHALNFIT